MRAWAVVEAGKPLEAITLPTPEPEGTEILVEVTHCGVCHSDLHFWKGEYNMGNGRVMKLSERGVELPRAPGHEIVGRVAGIGPDATGVELGDLRIVYPWIGCGQCVACLSEQDNMCSQQQSLGVVRNGGFASHVLVPHSRYLVDPGDIDPAIAATFACSGITTYSAIGKIMPIAPDRPVVLIGAGGVGLMAIAMLRALGHRNILSVDIAADKRAAAEAAGARAVDGGSASLAASIIEAAGGPVTAVLDFVNKDATARGAVDALAKGGTLVSVGVAGGELSISLAGLVFRVTTIRGSNTGSIQDLRDVVRLANTGRLAPTPVTMRPAHEANQALIDLKEGRVTGRQVLVAPHSPIG